MKPAFQLASRAERSQPKCFQHCGGGCRGDVGGWGRSIENTNKNKYRGFLIVCTWDPYPKDLVKRK